MSITIMWMQKQTWICNTIDDRGGHKGTDIYNMNKYIHFISLKILMVNYFDVQDVKSIFPYELLHTNDLTAHLLSLMVLKLFPCIFVEVSFRGFAYLCIQSLDWKYVVSWTFEIVVHLYFRDLRKLVSNE